MNDVGRHAANFFESTCIDCLYWRATTAYITPGRICQNEKISEYRKQKKALDGAGCPGFKDKDD